MPTFMFHESAEPSLFAKYANKAKREFRKMSPISIELQSNDYVEIKYFHPNGSEALVRYRLDK